MLDSILGHERTFHPCIRFSLLMIRAFDSAAQLSIRIKLWFNILWHDRRVWIKKFEQSEAYKCCLGRQLGNVLRHIQYCITVKTHNIEETVHTYPSTAAQFLMAERMTSTVDPFLNHPMRNIFYLSLLSYKGNISVHVHPQSFPSHSKSSCGLTAKAQQFNVGLRTFFPMTPFQTVLQHINRVSINRMQTA